VVKRTELAPLVVERAASRYADECRRLARRLEVWTVVLLLIATALAIGGAVGLGGICVPAGLGIITGFGSRRRHALAKHADTVATLAQRYPDIQWTEHPFSITGRTADGLKQPILLATTARANERLALPEARVMKRDDRAVH
jgi:hypothetical protein